VSGVSVKQPLSVDATDGAYTLNKTIFESVAQNLRTLVLTVPGERMMDLNFGVGLRNFLFEIDTPELRAKIRSKINEQVSRYMRFLEIVRIDIDASEDANKLSVSVYYNMNNEVTSTTISTGL
jgi:phage baseplate assembly protein W